MILHTVQQWLEQNIIIHKRHSFLSLMDELLGVYCENLGNWEKIDRVITTPHCNKLHLYGCIISSVISETESCHDANFVVTGGTVCCIIISYRRSTGRSERYKILVRLHWSYAFVSQSHDNFRTRVRSHKRRPLFDAHGRIMCCLLVFRRK